MKALSVSAQVPENKEKGTPQLGPVTVTVQTGETAAEKIQMFGDEAVSTNADANWVVTLQSNIRAGLRKGETQAQVQARLASAKMGVSAKGATVDPTQAYQAQFLAASAEDQVKMIKELQKRAEELRKS
jgi:hypothetical protein